MKNKDSANMHNPPKPIIMANNTTFNTMPQRIDEIILGLRVLTESLNKFIEKPENIPKYLNIDAIVNYLKSRGLTISKSRIYKMSASGELPVTKIDNKIYVTTKNLELWLQKMAQV